MARYGQTYGSGYGDPNNHIAWMNLDTSDPSFIGISFAPAPNLGDSFFSIYRNSRLVTRLFMAEGSDNSANPIIVSRDAGKSNSILILDDGQLADGNWINIDLVRSFEQGNSRPTLRWNWKYFVAGPDDQKTSNWSLVGLVYSQTQQTTIFKNQSDVSFDLTVTGSNVDVSVYVGSTEIMSGSGAFPGTIALAGVDVSGAVDIASGAVTSTGNKVRLVWPDAMTFYRTDSGGTILSTLGSSKFNYRDSATIQETGDLTNGTHYYKGKLTSSADDTDMSGFTMLASIIIANAPNPVTNLAIAASGTAASTHLTFTPSTTIGATYNLHLQRIGAPKIDLYTVEATSSGSSIALPTITGYPGTVRALVRAVSPGNEDKYLQTIDIEYDAVGNVVYARPNVPQINIVGIGYNGGNLQIPVIYNPLNEAGVATTAKLYYRADPAGAWTAFGTQPLVSQNGVKKATFNVTGLTSDLYYFAVTAITAAGSESDKSSQTSGFECGSFTVTAPTLTIDLARS